MGQGGHDRIGRKAAQRAEAAPFHRVAQVGQDRDRAGVARRDAVETRNLADQLVYTTEKFLAENGEKIPEDVKTEVQADVDALKGVLENSEASAEEINTAVTKLNESSQKMGAAMYAAAEADSAAAGGTTGATGEADDDVVDAEIVDEPTADDESTEDEPK